MLNVRKYLSVFLILLITLVSSLAAEESASGGGAPLTGLRLKGGLWGLGASFKSDFEQKYFIKDIAESGFLNTDWSETNKYYLVNPLGIEYGMGGLGPGTLILGLDFRGTPALDFTGFKPQYDSVGLSLYANAISINTTNLKFKNMDATAGYALKFGQFTVTPKYVFRHFTQTLQDTGLILGNGFAGFSDRGWTTSNLSGFLGVNLQFAFNETSSVFFDYIMSSPILGEWTSSANFNNLAVTSAATASIFDGNAKQVITGNRMILGYSHAIGSGLSFQIGYHMETLNTKYTGLSGIPIVLSRAGGDLDIRTLIIDRFAAFRSNNSTDIKSLYLSVTYQLGN